MKTLMDGLYGKAVEAAFTAGAEVFQAALKGDAKGVGTGYDWLASVAKAQVERTQNVALESAQRLGAVGTANVEAVNESASRLAEGAQTIGREFVGHAQQSFDVGVANVEALLACRTPQ